VGETADPMGHAQHARCRRQLRRIACTEFPTRTNHIKVGERTMATNTQATMSDRSWDVTLIASPKRVTANETVTLTVVLSHPYFDHLPEERHESFYNRSFEYQYSSRNSSELSKVLRDQADGNENPAKIQMPSLPDGDYEITVEVRMKPDLHTSTDSHSS